MTARASRNNLKAGAFLLVSLVLFMAIAMKLGDVYAMVAHRRTSYIVRFSLADGAMGLKKGSLVKVGGQQVGEVTGVGFEKPEGATETDPIQTQPQVIKDEPEVPVESGPRSPVAIYVTVSIDSDVQLFADAKVYLELPLLGTVSTINIPDVGGGTYGVPPQQIAVLQENQIIPGTLAPPTFLGQAGYGPEQKEQLQVILQRGKEIATQMSELVGATRDSLDQTLGSLKQAADNVNAATDQVNKQLPNWVDHITRTLANLTGASGEAEQRLIEAKALIGAVQSAIADNRAYLDRIFSGTARTTDSLAELTHKVNTELYDTVRDALIDGRRTMASFADVGDRAGQLLTEKEPELSRIIANARLASDQLKLAMTEVRRNPWRLLYQPTRRELEEELTYDAARTYADAVGQLRAASEAMEAITAAASAEGLTPEQRERLAALAKELEQAFPRLREAERRFLDRLTGNGGE